jgi:signal transduction histidine kinase/CheY-like chemotaxis protein
MLHNLIQRQAKKYIADQGQHIEGFDKFLQAISDSYNNYERDKELSSHAYALTEKEFIEINARLKLEIEERKKAVEDLIIAINTLDTKNEISVSNSLSLAEIIGYLKAQIIKRNETEAQLVIAKEIAEKAAYARSEFLSMMSHEIRTPLNAVLGTAYLLQQDNPGTHQAQYLGMLKFSAENLMLLINDILDFNKIEAGKITLETVPFNLHKLITQVKNTNQKRAADNGSKIRVMFEEDLPTTVVGDALRLGQILTNLVSNAAKFTKNGQITMQALLVEKDDTTVTIQISVQDTGIGIAPENHQKIFDKFIQASDSTTREFGGTGLGLAISNKLIQVMGSKFELDSEVGKGSTFSFTITLPYLHSAHEEENEKDTTTEIFDLSGIHLLLVEDNEFNSIIASTLLRNWKATVELAWNGNEAYEKATQNNYDVILMDLHMPLMNGYDATEKILAKRTDIPILALTASAMLDIKDKAFKCGMLDYITKPFNPNELYEKIRRYANKN